ncbi:MAG: hypothetical protein AAF514_10190, partial [Verrucomicrobiota bacterium]
KQATEFFQHVNRLGTESLDGRPGEGSYDDGSTFGGDLISKLLARSNDLPTLDFALARLQDQEPPLVERSQRALFAEPLLDIVRTPVKEEKGPEDRLDALYKGIGRSLTKSAFPYLADGLFESYHYLTKERGADADTLMTWLDEKRKNGAYPDAAVAMSRFLRLWVVENADPAENDTRTPDEAVASLTTSIEKADVNPIARLALTESLLSRFPHSLGEALADPAHRLLTDAWQSGLNVPASQAELLATFLPEKANPDPLLKAWRDQRLRQRVQPNHQLTRTMFRLAVQSNDNELTNEILKRRAPMVDFSWFHTLLRSGALETAGTLFRDRWQLLEPAPTGSEADPLFFEPEFTEQLPAIAPLLKNQDLSLFCQALVLSLPDNPEEKAEKSNPRETRLREFAGRVAAHTFQDPVLEKRVLSHLVNEPEVLEPLKERFARVGTGISTTAIFRTRKAAERKRLRSLLKTYLRFSMTEGPAVVQSRLEKLEKIRFRDPSSRLLAAQPIREAVKAGFLNDWKKWEPARLKENLSFWRSTLAKVEVKNLLGAEMPDYLALNEVMHALGGQNPDLEAWKTGLDEATSERLTSERKENFFPSLFEIAGNALKASGARPEERRTVFERLYTAPAYIESAKNDPEGVDGVFPRSIEHGLINEEDLLEHGAEWAEANPRLGFAMAELAQAQNDNEREDDALKSLDLALEKVEAEETGHERYSRFTIQKIQWLLDQKKQKDARQTFEAFDKERLDRKHRKAWRDLQKQMAQPRVIPGEVA